MRLSTSLLATTFLARHWTSDGLGKFSYKNNDSKGPNKWDKVNAKDNEWREWKSLKADKNECGKEKNRQSPVDLVKNEDCRADHQMLFSDGTCAFDDIIFEVTPYSLKGTFPIDKCQPPGMDLSDSFNERYVNTFELKLPGEHTIDGEAYDGEIQFSHVVNVDDDWKWWENRNHQVAMCARHISGTKKKDDKYIERFLKKWEEAADKHADKCQASGKGTISLSSIQRRQLRKQESQKERELHKSLWTVTKKKPHDVLRQPFKNQYYYGYKGSLTVPPCSDFVLWYIVDNPMEISPSQLSRLRDLIKDYINDDCEKDTYADENGNVNRPIQKKHKHNIFHCDESDYSN